MKRGQSDAHKKEEDRQMAGPVIEGENYRISVLTESLVRLEYSEDGVF